MEKRKNKPMKFLNKYRFLIGAVLCMGIGLYWVVSAHREEHCVAQIEPEVGGLVAPASEPRCFPTQAEAIYYATGGAVNLPLNASNSDVNAALEALYSEDK